VKVLWRNLVISLLLAVPVYAQAARQSSPERENKAVAESATPIPDAGPSAPAPESKVADVQFPMVRTIGGMGVVVFIMLGVFFAAKKFAPRYFNKSVSQRNLKIIETLGMGDRRSISLVEVGNSRYLLGNTPHQISLLATLPNQVSFLSEPEEMPAPAKSVAKKSGGAPFRSLFEVERGRTSIQHAAHPLPDDLRVKMRQLREALERS
jgi:flagellar biosynthetic protein FliO